MFSVPINRNIGSSVSEEAYLPSAEAIIYMEFLILKMGY